LSRHPNNGGRYDAKSYQDIAAAFAGHPVGNLTRDQVLDITMTWVTNTGISSGRLYWQNTLGFFDVKGATVPAAVSVFPREPTQELPAAFRPLRTNNDQGRSS
jgi:hypothetical protein